MIDQTELQKLISAPLGTECKITDPFTKTKLTVKLERCQDEGKDINICDYTIGGSIHYEPLGSGKSKVIITARIPKSYDLSSKGIQDELCAVLSHEFGHACNANKQWEEDIPNLHAYALGAPSELAADDHALLCGYGQQMIRYLQKSYNTMKEHAPELLPDNADISARIKHLQGMMKAHALKKGETSKKVSSYSIDLADQDIGWISYNGTEYTEIVLKIISMTYKHHDKNPNLFLQLECRYKGRNGEPDGTIPIIIEDSIDRFLFKI